MKKQLRNSIRKAYNTLTDGEKETLGLICILCTDVKEVSLRNLCDVMGTKPHVFEKDVMALAKAGLLAIQVNILFPPTEVVNALSDVPVPVDRLNGCISRLSQKTTLSTEDMLQIRPYFAIATSILRYVLAHPDGEIEYETFGRLLVNVTRYYDIFAKPDISVYKVENLSLMCGLKLVKSKMDHQSLLYAMLCTCQAFILLNGFHYSESRRLLDEALSIAHDDKETLVWCYFVNALWWENYGVMARCLEFAYKAWEIAGDAFKTDISVYIAYQLALLEEYTASDEWVNNIDKQKYPQNHAVKIYYYLIEAMKGSDESLVEDYLMQAECLLNQINHQAPLKARLFYVRHHIYTKWGLCREACEQYRLYANCLGVQYASTEAGVCLYAATEVDRLTAMGALIGAKHVLQHTLDFINLSSSEYALSVKLGICLTYVRFYLASGYFALADVHYNMGKDIAKQLIPHDDTMNILLKLFKGAAIPAAVSGEDYVWWLEYEHLQALLADQDVEQQKKKQQIELLMKRFPSHQGELEVIAASLLNSNDAIYAWHMAIIASERNRKFEIALQCARIAVAQGLLWDGAAFYNIVLNTDGFKAQTKYQMIDILLEVAQTFERCGERGNARLIWIQLEVLAKSTNKSKLADIYQARASSFYDHEQYLEALEYFDKCLADVHTEDGFIDQRLSSIYAFKSSCYGALGEYHLAYEAAVKAKEHFPLQEFSAFNLEYNHGFFAICLKKYEEAREILTRAKALARSEDELASVEEQLSILAMKKEDREAYLKQNLYNFDCEN